MANHFIKKFFSFSHNKKKEASNPEDNTNPIEIETITAKPSAQILDPIQTDSPAQSPSSSPSWIDRVTAGMARSSKHLHQSLATLLNKRKLDKDLIQEIEDVLIQSDLGVTTTESIIQKLQQQRFDKDSSLDEVMTLVHHEICKVLEPVAKSLELNLSHKPHIILIVGVNGTGKTTTIGKLAAKLTQRGLKVMLAAGDTFRAAAIEQLHIWGERTNSPVISANIGSDAAALAYNAYQQALSAGSDVLIIDTAGRLHNKKELMDELAKIVRVLGKNNPGAPHTILQTLDATTGQNILHQVKMFRSVAGVNGLIITKLDGTARGGILVAVAAEHQLPVYFIGVGETIEDLQPFSAEEFTTALITK